MGQLEIIVKVSDEARRINMEEGLTIRASIKKAKEKFKEQLKENNLLSPDQST